MSEAVLVMTTIDSRSKAEHLAELIISEGLSACAQISERMTSIYIWKGQLHNENEYLISFKSIAEKKQILMQALRSNHSYETPEIIALDIDNVDESYLKWMQAVIS